MVTYTSSTDPWVIDPTAFPYGEDDEAKLRFLARYAALAPSSHNTQPWRFLIGDGALTLYADWSRRLPVSDPDDRELTLSCGAALFFLRIAAMRYGRTPEVQRFPDPIHPDLLAVVRLGGLCCTRPDANALFAAIPHRRTNRGPLVGAPLRPGLTDELRRAVWKEGSRLALFEDGSEKNALADLVAEGDRAQFADPAFRAELAAWVRPPAAGDGLTLHGLGVPAALDGLAPAAAAVLRRFDLGRGQAARDRELAAGAPLLGLLASREDTPLAWLRTGEALGCLLLRSQLEGMQASYLNQPIQVPALREEVERTFCPGWRPQVLLRLGFGATVPPSARRPFDDVVR